MVKERPLKLRHDTLGRRRAGYGPLYGLAGGLFAAWFLQFFTGLFEHWPALGQAAAVGVALAGGAVAMQGAREPTPLRRVLLLAGGLAAASAALWVLQAKTGYARSLMAHPWYAAPRFETSPGPGAREIRLTCPDGVAVDGTWWASRQPAAIILYPSWLSGRRGFAVTTLARWLAPSFQILALDPRGVGESGGFQRGLGDGRLDVLAAVAFLREKGAVRVGVLAEGDAGLAAALAVAERGPAARPETAMDALLLADPTPAWGLEPKAPAWWNDPRTSAGRTYWRVAAGVRLARGSGPNLAEVLPRIAPVPVLLLAGPDGARSAQQLYQVAAEPRGLRLLPGTGRPIGWDAYPAYYAAVRDWFRLVLAPLPASGSAEETMPAPAATPSPEEAQLKQILAEPQPLVPELPAPPAGR